MKRLALVLVLPFALACGGDDANDSYSTAGDVSGMDSPSINLTGAACLVGMWEMDIETSYNMDAINAMIAAEGDIDMTMELVGSDGHIYMTLNDDGTAESTMDNAVMIVNADTPMGEMTVTNTMNGMASGTYAVNSDTLNFADGGDSDMTTNTEVTMGGNQVSNSSSDQDSVFESGAGTAMTFECTGDVLLIDIHETSGESQLVFEDMRFVRSGGPA